MNIGAVWARDRDGVHGDAGCVEHGGQHATGFAAERGREGHTRPERRREMGDPYAWPPAWKWISGLPPPFSNVKVASGDGANTARLAAVAGTPFKQPCAYQVPGRAC